MRGTGSLRTLIGRPIYGKAQQQHEDAHAAPAPKKQKQGQQHSKSTGGLAAGQKSIFNFYSVAAPTPSSTAAASSDAAAVSPGQQQQQQPPRCRSAPLPTQAGSVAPQAATNSSSSHPSWSSASRSDSAADASQQSLPEPSTEQQQQCLHQQQQQQLQEEDEEEMATVPAIPGPLLVSTRVVGRQHQSAGWPPAAGAELLLAREPTNPVDPCAILVRPVPLPDPYPPYSTVLKSSTRATAGGHCAAVSLQRCTVDAACGHSSQGQADPATCVC